LTRKDRSPHKTEGLDEIANLDEPIVCIGSLERS
jgi:hypothetical protein